MSIAILKLNGISAPVKNILCVNYKNMHVNANDELVVGIHVWINNSLKMTSEYVLLTPKYTNIDFLDVLLFRKKKLITYTFDEMIKQALIQDHMGVREYLTDLKKIDEFNYISSEDMKFMDDILRSYEKGDF